MLYILQLTATLKQKANSLKRSRQTLNLFNQYFLHSNEKAMNKFI